MPKTILLFFLCCFSNVFAQSKATITGNIKSSENENLVGASISIDTNNQYYYTISDTLGNFRENIPLGQVKITVNQLGYLKKSIPFNFLKDTVLTIELEKDISLLKEVIISNDKKNGITTLSGGKLSFNLKELSAVPTVLGTTDIIKLLQLTPGVQNSGDANGYLYVRGGDPGHNAILYDGTPIYGMSHLLGVFPFYNTDHIKEVEFDKSSSNAKYGGRLSSTTLLIPNKKIPAEFGIQGNVGLLASQLTLAVPLAGKSGFYISGRRTYIDEIVAPLLSSDSESSDVQDMKYGFADGNMTFISQISKNNLLSVDAFISGDKLNIKDDNLALKTSLKWSNFTVSPTLITTFSPKTTMSNAVYFSTYKNELNMEQATIEFGVSSYVKDFGFNNAFRYWLKNIPVESGLQYVHHNLQPQKVNVENLTDLNNTAQNNIINADEAAVFTTIRPKITERLNAELGLRINYYTSGANTSYLHFQPRILINYSASEKYSFYGSYNRQYQYLSLITTSSVGIPTDFWIASSDGIKPQSSDEFSIGSNQTISKNFSSSLGGFYRSMKDLLEYPYGITQFNEVTTLKNDLLVGKGKAYGFEMMLRKNNGKFTGWLSYTLSWSDRNFDELNSGNTYFAKYDRRHNLSVVGMYDLNQKWNLGVTQIFSSGNRFTMPTSWYFINNNPVKEYSEYNNAQMPNYIRTDLSVNYFFLKTNKKESALNFSIYNTFNIDNPIYVILDVKVNKDKNSVVVRQEKKTLYRILPSISWRFKF
ncbi:outer membrane receptor protein involved in Fe transport [Flavobacterium araucananum]|uniref:Oxidoreductase n=1 Tax=Flavobacterium araucananum TaxID=946678 RepID=A0A227PC63_9FLAO|nr:TonB-dependent receptor plug domain-containing protein [Flavobacterium araucananum]OXG07372.1 oxidoreductase [Flavobacterium araucananum]PWK03172.1 outer membrane receptor protein involved in Fe transport [Flavobacterium araucananum]